MATRTVYAVLEQHWIYDDEDWNMHLLVAPLKAYATGAQAESAREAMKLAASEQQKWRIPGKWRKH